MSEEVTIKELLDLKESLFKGQSGIDLEATVTRVVKTKEGNLTREVKGSKDGRDYHFFSQFVVINDGTADIGMDFAVGKAEDAITKGMKVKVEKAKTETYEDKNGKTWRKLTKGKVSFVGEGSQEGKPEGAKKKVESEVTKGYYITFGPNDKVVTNPDVLRARNMLITRTAVAKCFIEQGYHLAKGFKQILRKEEFEEWIELIYGEGVIIATVKPTVELKDKPKTKKSKDNPRSKGEEKKTVKPLANMVKPVGDETMGRIGRLYAKAFQMGKFKPGYELADWLDQNWKKKSLIALTEAELDEAERELAKMVKGKAKK